MTHLPETITLLPREGTKAGGQPNYGTGIQAYGRIQYAAKNARDNRGEAVLSKCQVQFDGSVPADNDGGITLPDGVTMPILEIREYRVKASVWMKEIYT